MAEDGFGDGEVRALLDRCSDAVYRADGQAVGDCWDEQGVCHAFGRRVEGRAAVVEAVRAVADLYELV